MKYEKSDNKKVNDYIEALDPGLQALFLEVREVVRKAGPSLAEDIKWKNCLTYVAGSKNLIQTVAGKDKVSLIFHNGAALENPDGILEGDGAKVRTVRITDAKFSKAALKRAVKNALKAL